VARCRSARSRARKEIQRGKENKCNKRKINKKNEEVKIKKKTRRNKK
jgi:hypothetical protein